MIVDEEVYLDHELKDFFEHHGIKGQKWGVRKYRRMETHAKVGRGMGRTGERVRSAVNVGPIDLVKGRGFKGGARRRAARQKIAFDRVGTGKTTARNILTRVAAKRFQDILPTGQSKKNTSAAVGASVAGVILYKVGKRTVVKAVKSKL